MKNLLVALLLTVSVPALACQGNGGAKQGSGGGSCKVEPIKEEAKLTEGPGGGNGGTNDLHGRWLEEAPKLACMSHRC